MATLTDNGSGNGSHGTLVGGGITATADRFGAPNRALNFDGNSYVQVADAVVMQVPKHSISVWFTWDNLGTDTIDFLTGKDDPNFEFHTGGSPGVNGIRYLPAPGIANDTSGIIHAQWNHVVGTWDSSTNTSKVYFDGVLQNTTTNMGFPVLTGDFFIGSRGDTAKSFRYDGSIDDVRLYNHVLTQSEVTALFTAIPEPGSFALMGLAMVGISSWRWLRRRRWKIT